MGGKKALRKLIYTMFPVNFDRYIEVFGGGGWVLFGRPPDCRCMEVYNDYNSNLANLFTCVKERTWAFLKELGFLPVNGRDEFAVIRRFLDKQEFDAPFLAEELKLAQVSLPEPDFEEIRAILMENAEVTDVKRAAAFFKLIRYSYGSGCTSYGCKNFDVRKCFDTIWQASRRLADTVVENKDFEALIRQYDRDSAFFYCDPPYYETEGHYAVVFRREDHARLRDVLCGRSLSRPQAPAARCLRIPGSPLPAAPWGSAPFPCRPPAYRGSFSSAQGGTGQTPSPWGGACSLFPFQTGKAAVSGGRMCLAR